MGYNRIRSDEVNIVYHSHFDFRNGSRLFKILMTAKCFPDISCSKYSANLQWFTGRYRG